VGTHTDYSDHTAPHRVISGKAKGRPKRRWLDNINMDLGEIEWGGMDWIGLARGREQRRARVKTVMNVRAP
jgi:hypothetical protein